MKKNIIVLVFAVLLLSACGERGLRLIAESQPRIFPPIDYPAGPDLAVVEWDVPRQGGQPVLNSNIFLGLSQEGYEAYLENMAKLEARERMWRARVDEVNRQRAAEAGTAPAPTPAATPAPVVQPAPAR